MDDFVLFARAKEPLQRAKEQIEKYLERLRLRLHERKCRVYRVDEGLTFLGYRIFPTHRLLKKANVLHMRRKLKKLSLLYRVGQIPLIKVDQSIQSWIGHAGHADTYKLRERIFSGVVFQKG